MSFAYITTVLWAVGILALVVCLLKFIAKVGDYWGMLAGFLLVPIIGWFIAVLPFALVYTTESSTLATLKKSEWRCTEKENVKTVAVVKSQTIYSDAEVCKRYERN